MTANSSITHAKLAFHSTADCTSKISNIFWYFMVCELLVVTIYQSMFTVCWTSVLSRFQAKLGRMTCAFVYTSLYDIFHKCQPNLSLQEQPLLNALDVFGVGWVIIRPFHGAAAEMLPKMTHDPTYTFLVCSGWRPTFYPISLCWLNLKSQSFVWNVF